MQEGKDSGGQGFRWYALGVCLAAMAVSGIAPADRSVWRVEIVWAVIATVSVFLFSRKFRFSRPAICIFTLWILLQCIGAHYTFERVPMEWLTRPLGLVRDPYDRIAHFCIGLYAWPVAEWAWNARRVTSRGMAVFLAVSVITAMAGVWEIVEWTYAEIDGGSTGLAFLGSQGDIWDAQKDILCDFLGALASAFGWRFLGNGKTAP